MINEKSSNIEVNTNVKLGTAGMILWILICVALIRFIIWGVQMRKSPLDAMKAPYFLLEGWGIEYTDVGLWEIQEQLFAEWMGWV